MSTSRWESLESTRGVRFLKQFGAERTGTNTINVMCRRAFGFNPLTNTFVQKHNSFSVDRFPNIDIFGFLISIRDPYGWALSYARWKKHKEMSPVWFEGACDYWNHLYRSYLGIPDEKRVMVRQEAVMTEPVAVLERIAEQFGLPVVGELSGVDRVVHPHERVGAKPFDSRYYLERRYLDELPQNCIHAVTDTIDWGLLTPFYEPE